MKLFLIVLAGVAVFFGPLVGYYIYEYFHTYKGR